MQNFACRIVSGARKYDHISPICKELNWLPVANQLYYRSATMAFKGMTGHAPEYLSSKFLKQAEVSGRSTRNSQLLNTPLGWVGVCVCVCVCVFVYDFCIRLWIICPLAIGNQFCHFSRVLAAFQDDLDVL